MLAALLGTLTCFVPPRHGLYAEGQQTFRTGVDLVRVEVSVLDRDRRPVRGLTEADFTVYDQGKRATITGFAAVEIPVAAVTAGAAQPDVFTNQRSQTGRAIGIIMPLMTSKEQIPLARMVARKVVGFLGESDMAAVIWPDDIAASQRLTGDKGRLLTAIDTPTILPPPLLPRCETISNAIAQFAESVSGVPRWRKLVVLLASGITLRDSPVCAGAGRARDTLFRFVDLTNLSIYPFDPAGLSTLSPNAAVRLGPGSGRADRTGMMQAELRREGSLLAIAERTGGRAAINTNTPEDFVKNIFDETSTYYVFGFEPSPPKDGRDRHIKIVVHRADVTVIARRLYEAPGRPASSPRSIERSDVPRALVEAIDGMWPRSAINMAFTAVPLAPSDRDPRKVRFAIALHGSVASERDSVPFDVLVAAFNERGQAEGYDWRHIEGISQRGVSTFDWTTTLDLTPGRYDLRAAAVDTALNRNGSVITDFDAPPLNSEAFGTSGIMLATPAAGVDLALAGLTARREFERAEPLVAHARVFQAGSESPVDVAVRFTVVSVDGSSVLDDSRILPREEFSRRQPPEYRISIPTDRMSAGAYVCRLSLAAGAHRIDRSTAIVIR